MYWIKSHSNKDAEKEDRPIGLHSHRCFRWFYKPYELLPDNFFAVSLRPGYKLLGFTWTWLRYVRIFAIANSSVACLSSVTFVRPILRGLKLSAISLFLRLFVYLSHHLTSWCKFFLRRLSEGNPSVGGIKGNTGSKIERCHVRISHLLVSFLSLCLLIVECAP